MRRLPAPSRMASVFCSNRADNFSARPILLGVYTPLVFLIFTSSCSRATDSGTGKNPFRSSHCSLSTPCREYANFVPFCRSQLSLAPALVPLEQLEVSQGSRQRIPACMLMEHRVCCVPLEYVLLTVLSPCCNTNQSTFAVTSTWMFSILIHFLAAPPPGIQANQRMLSFWLESVLIHSLLASSSSSNAPAARFPCLEPNCDKAFVHQKDATVSHLSIQKFQMRDSCITETLWIETY